MKNTKLQILSEARTLFNQKGFSNVTIRMIANELGMSSGNLNYHFKTREAILEALYFEMVEVFDARVASLRTQKITMKSIGNDIYSSLERMQDYRFFWTDLYNLLRLSKTIKAHFSKAYYRRVEGCNYLFHFLINQDLMLSFESTLESDFLIERMIDFSNTWLYNSSVYEKPQNKAYVQKQTHKMLMMLYPYFTSKGKTALKNSFPIL